MARRSSSNALSHAARRWTACCAQVEAVEQIFDEAEVAGQDAFEELEKKLEKDALRKHLSR